MRRRYPAWNAAPEHDPHRIRPSFELSAQLESRPNVKSEPELLFLLQSRRVQHALALRVLRKNQPERHVQHRHLEPNFRAGRRDEITHAEPAARCPHDRWQRITKYRPWLYHRRERRGGRDHRPAG